MRLATLLTASFVALGLAACGSAVETPTDTAAEIEEAPSGATWDASGWQRPDDAELRARLTALQYQVTQQDGTERSFDNAYWDNKAAGLYVDVVSGEPLFSSTHKYKSGTGWPSFWQPLGDDVVTEHVDDGLFMTRTEVRSAVADSHLGHVFDDGPAPTGLRYCMNSAAMRFVPVDELEAQGYGAWLPLFEDVAADASQR